jgi:hypothetical protein
LGPIWVQKRGLFWCCALQIKELAAPANMAIN